MEAQCRSRYDWAGCLAEAWIAYKAVRIAQAAQEGYENDQASAYCI